MIRYPNSPSNATSIGGKDIDMSAIGDGKALKYDSTTGKIVFGAVDALNVNAVNIGDGTDTTKYIYINNGDANKPGIRYNSGTNKFEYSNDGLAWSEMGSGSGGGGYKTIWVPAGAMISATDAGASPGTYEWATNHLDKDYLAFSGATPKNATFSLVMDEAWDRSTIKAKFYWTYTAVINSGTKVEWGIKGIASSDGEAIDTAYGTQQVIYDTRINTSNTHVSSATPAVTIGGAPALGDNIQFLVTRNTGSADDDIDIEVWLLGVLLQYNCTNTPSVW